MTRRTTIGILGGGQLGRMLANAAYDMGFSCVIWDENAASPALKVTDEAIIAPYDSAEARQKFIDKIDVAVLEFENIPCELVAEIQKHMLVTPSAEALTVVQNRILEKSFFDDNKIPCADWQAIESESDALAAGKKLGYPLILKTCRFGYDGKGQGRASSDAEIVALWHELGSTSCIVEVIVPFDCEVSVIGARNPKGDIAVFEVAENYHENHILRNSTLPAKLSASAINAAESYLRTAIESLNIVGLLALEMFVVGDKILANEMAARPHNSGHWTMDGAVTSQFEQAIRAAVGLPLGDTRRTHDIVMQNLLGDEVAELDWHDPSAKIHIYGKPEIRAGRKMGHINFLKGKL